MTQQYIRSAKLVLGSASGEGLDVSELRFLFMIQHPDTQTLKTLGARVYNMAPQTIAKAAAKEFTKVQLTAGYQGNAGVIFQGEITQTRTGRENLVDTYFDVFAQDGDTGCNQATVNHTLAAGATAAQVRDKILAAFGTYGFTAGNKPELSPIALPRAQVFYGMARDHMRVLARDNGCTWGFDNGAVNMIPKTSTLPGTAIVLTAETGMIGLPEQTQDGIRIRCLLNPQLKCGGLVQINNASIQQARQAQGVKSTGASRLPEIGDGSGKRDGFYKIISIDYIGDTRGEDWYCDLVGISTDPKGAIPDYVAQVGGL